MIINIVIKKNDSSDGDEDSDDANLPMKISHTNILKAIESAIEYVEYIEQQEKTTPAILLSLKMVKHCCKKTSKKYKTKNN